jgi:hypothetical protein
MHASTSRKAADTAVPSVPPSSRNASKRSRSANAVSATPSVAATTIVEWPSEKNRPTVTGRRPSCISLRVATSIAAM